MAKDGSNSGTGRSDAGGEGLGFYTAKQAAEAMGKVAELMSHDTPPERAAEILESIEPLPAREYRPTVKLGAAHLCVQCESIYEGDRGGCPDCGNRVGFAVARVIAPKDEPAPWRRGPEVHDGVD